jgi:hypothetical protein
VRHGNADHGTAPSLSIQIFVQARDTKAAQSLQKEKRIPTHRLTNLYTQVSFSVQMCSALSEQPWKAADLLRSTVVFVTSTRRPCRLGVNEAVNMCITSEVC